MNENNLYVILNVSRNATQEEIKKSYKKIIVKIHPDKHINDKNHNEYEKEFIKVKDAFDILSNKDKRQKYNELTIESTNKEIFKKKSKSIFNFIKKPSFYLLFFNNVACSNFSFINNFLVNGDVFEILDITKDIEFTLHEYYNNTPKLFVCERLTRDVFIENIFAIDNTQIYEKEGEVINIDDINHYGNLSVNIKITNMSYKNREYHIIDNDIVIFINKKNIVKNKIKLEFLDDKIHMLKINKLKKLKLTNDNISNTSNIYYIRNMGLPYFDTNNNEINNINLLNIKRGKLFFILII